MFQSKPTPQDFDEYSVTNPNWSQILRQSLYDYQLYPTAGQQQMLFFTVPIGAGVTSAVGAVAGTAKTRLDTNMQQGGTLSSGKRQMVEAIEVDFQPGSVSTANTYTVASMLAFAVAAAATVGQAWVNDITSFYQSGQLEFKVLDSVVHSDTPLRKFPAATQFVIDAAIASNSATVGEVIAAKAGIVGPLRELSPPIALEPTVSFNVSLNWPAAVATPSGFNARVGIVLQGYEQRVGQ
jgi:hypothetical protein